jgi:hypothetical protein
MFIIFGGIFTAAIMPLFVGINLHVFARAPFWNIF